MPVKPEGLGLGSTLFFAQPRSAKSASCRLRQPVGLEKTCMRYSTEAV